MSLWGGLCLSVPSCKVFEGRLTQEEMYLDESEGGWFEGNSKSLYSPFWVNTELSSDESSSVGRGEEVPRFGVSPE